MGINNSKFAIEERRRQVASMLARSMTETEIAQALNVSQPTISNDIKALKEKSQQFIYDLAKSDISYYYKLKLDSLDEAKREAWNIYKNTNEATLNTDKLKLLALKTIIMSDQTSIDLLNEGPGILTMQMMENRLNDLEQQQEEH
jgi:DNA-binding transcriptional ArsR family regulator